MCRLIRYSLNIIYNSIFASSFGIKTFVSSVPSPFLNNLILNRILKNKFSKWLKNHLVNSITVIRVVFKFCFALIVCL